MKGEIDRKLGQREGGDMQKIVDKSGVELATSCMRLRLEHGALALPTQLRNSHECNFSKAFRNIGGWLETELCCIFVVLCLYFIRFTLLEAELLEVINACCV